MLESGWWMLDVGGSDILTFYVLIETFILNCYPFLGFCHIIVWLFLKMQPQLLNYQLCNLSI